MPAWRTAVPVLAVAIVGTVGGCSDPEPVQTAPTSSETTAATMSVDPAARLWDPCTLPDSALAAAGINTATKEKDVAGVAFEGWKVCGWRDTAKTYSFTVYASEHSIDEVRARTDRTEFSPVRVGSYNGLQYRPAGSSRDSECFISVAVGRQMIDFSVLNRHSARRVAKDACQETHRLAEALVQNVPAS
ncbi:DUF3558 domain-containing protein [Nocardia asteroides]|uniref:DUF3558 domain-containing protein n=1 Tax=Nocardia asteroides TaxID=1824 RepID=UPI0033E6B2D0